MSDYISNWTNLETDAAPILYPGDEELRNSNDAISIEEWDEYQSYLVDTTARDTELHTALIPMPYVGNLRTADIYVLMLNPGLSPLDYFAETRVQQYREALVGNLKQRTNRFLFLEHDYAWTGGYQYWHGVFRPLITKIAELPGEEYESVRAQLSARLALLQYVPYHSKSFKNSALIRRLASPKASYDYVHKYVLPKARRGEAIVFVPRASKYWQIEPENHVVLAQGRRVSLAADSPGGLAIADFWASKRSTSGGA